MQKALRVRKVLGGGMRQVNTRNITNNVKNQSLPQVGILAAAGLFALDNHVERLADDHKHAQNAANIINAVGKNRFSVDLIQFIKNVFIFRFVAKNVESNLVLMWVDPTLTTPSAVESALATGEKVQVRTLAVTQTELRLAFHCNITKDMAEATNCKMEKVLKQFLEK